MKNVECSLQPRRGEKQQKEMKIRPQCEILSCDNFKNILTFGFVPKKVCFFKVYLHFACFVSVALAVYSCMHVKLRKLTTEMKTET